jgi:hypothetical protein
MAHPVSSFEPGRATEDDLIKWDAECGKRAAEYADFVYQKQFFEQASKDYLASLKLKAMESAEKMSDAESETRARASKEWASFREQQFGLLKEAGRREIQLESAVRHWETRRSCLSLRREEAKRQI